MREKIRSPVCMKRERQGTYDPINYHYDQVPTFLVCQKLSLDVTQLPTELSTLYDPSVPARFQLNLILSLEDGLFCYYDENDKTMMYPVFKGKALHNRRTYPTTNPYVHLKLFCSYLFLMTSSTTILYPDITDYMGSMEGGLKLDECG